MEEREAQKILTDILFVALNETEISPDILQKITPDVLSSVYDLAKRHDLAHIVSAFVWRNRIEVNEQLREKLQRAEFTSVYRYKQTKYAFEQICDAFEEAGIAYIPLKGSILRPYYPYESMRTSCDIDILIHESDLDVAIACLKSKGYHCAEKQYHDVSLYSPNKIHLELHFNIQENTDYLDVVLKDAWQHAALSKGCRYDFSKEFFVFYMYAHMSYHFLSGGCGIRSLMDIWIMEHKMDAQYLCAEHLLKKTGIYKFATEISKIANQCFSLNNQCVSSDLILKYIYVGGTYGSSENNIAVHKSKKSGSLTYIMARLFLPYKSMTILYPALKKFPVLLPFCWVARWIKAIFGGKTKKIASEMACFNNISDEQIEEVKEICSRLGLDK